MEYVEELIDIVYMSNTYMFLLLVARKNDHPHLCGFSLSSWITTRDDLVSDARNHYFWRVFENTVRRIQDHVYI